VAACAHGALHKIATAKRPDDTTGMTPILAFLIALFMAVLSPFSPHTDANSSVAALPISLPPPSSASPRHNDNRLIHG
jgi:hypothetical protein